MGALLASLNKARQTGVTIPQLDNLLAEAGHDFTYRGLADMAKESLDNPPEARGPVTTEQILVGEGQGASLSFLDEIMGAMAVPVGAPGAQGAALSGNEALLDPAARSEAVREDVRETTNTFRSERPFGAFASEVGGGFMVPALGTGGTVAKMTGGAKRVMSAMGISAAIGAVAGAGEAETLEELPSMVLGGAGFGALLGGTLTGAGQAIGAIGAPVFMHMAGNFATHRVGRFAVGQALREAAEKSGITGDDFRRIFTELNEARPGHVIPADVSRTLEDLLVRNVGRTQDDIGELVSRVRERPAGAPERMARDLQYLADWEGLSNATAKTIAGEVTGRMPQGGRAAVSFERGQEAYRSQLSGPRLDAEIATITREAGARAPEVIEAYRFGIVSEMWQDLMETPRGGANIGRAFSEGAEAGMSPARAGLIRRAFPNERAYRQFVQGAEVEDAFFRLRNLTEAGAREAVDEEGSRMFQAARRGSVWGMRAMIFSLLSGQNSAVRRETAKEIVRLLMSPGDVNAITVQSLINARLGGRTARALSGAGAAVGATATAQSGRMSLDELLTLDLTNNEDLTRLLGGGGI